MCILVIRGGARGPLSVDRRSPLQRLFVSRGGTRGPLSVDRQCSLLRLLVGRGGALRPLSVDRQCSLLRLLVGLPWLSVCPPSPCLRLTLTLVPRRPSSLAWGVGLPASASMAGADSLLCRVGPRRTFRSPLCPPHSLLCFSLSSSCIWRCTASTSLCSVQ